MRKLKEKITKKLAGAFFIVLAILGLGVPAIQPTMVYAQLAVTDPALTAIETSETILDKIKGILKKVFDTGAAVLWKNVVGNFLNTLAQDTAKWIADGGKGQEPLFISEGWGDYLQSTAENAVATGVIAFAEEIGLGNICLSQGIAIEILLPIIEEPRVGGKAKCSLEDLKKNWDVRDPKFLENFNLSFKTGQNDLAVSVNFLNSLKFADEYND